MAQCVQCEVELPPGAQFCANCGTQVTIRTETSIDPYLGRVFAQKYRVDALLGEGGMGRVYKATQLSLDKVVCLKVLRRELANDPSTQARFQREARAASRLNHPNSIQVMDFGAADAGELYLAMEYIAGRDLQQLLAAEFPLAEARVCHIMAQVLDALAEAHAQHVIHRDLKPENIMVYEHRGDPDWVKVLDFGIAKIQDNDTQPKLTRAGLVCGTPEYMSPEQARGLELDARSDLYSAGIILYQMVTGTLPFNADSPIGFVTAHLNEHPVPPGERRAGISPAMQQLILRTLSKNRDERPGSAKEMWSELLAIEQGDDPEPVTSLNRRPHGSLKSAPPLGNPTEPVDHGYPRPAPMHPLRPAPSARAAPPKSRLGLGLALGLIVVALGSAAFAAHRFYPLSATAPSPGGRPNSMQESQQAYEEAKALYQQALDDKIGLEKHDSLLTQALNRYYHAYKLNPSDPAPQYGMGLAYQGLGKVPEAIDAYQKYVTAVPAPPNAGNVRRTIDILKQQQGQQ